MEAREREFQIFAKPVGALCNLRCGYCYYIGKQSIHGDARPLLMSDDILEKYIVQHIEATTDDVIFFSWHGGEPLMAGIDFFRKAVSLQEKYKPAGKEIINGIQTNATLIDWDWAYFLAQEKFLVGISIDGPGDLHNQYRKAADGNSSLQQVLKGYDILQRSGIKPEILCVVSSFNVKFPLVVYDFFRELGAENITFLPLVEKRPRSASGVSRATVPATEFGSFLMAVFDEWLEKDIGKIKIQIIEEAARTAFGQKHTLCIFRENCGGVPVVELNGDFYSCDHYVDKEHLVGNISDGTIAEFLDSDRQKEFGMLKSLTLPRYCLECDVRSLCNGECPRNRFIKTPDGEPGLNYLCEGYKAFFHHCKPFVDAIGGIWNEQNAS